MNRTPPAKLSNGTVPKSISNDDNEVLISKDDHYSNKEVLEKQRNYSDEPKLLVINY